MSVIGSDALAGASGQSSGGSGYVIEKSLRFNDGDSAYLNRTPSSAGNRKTWTISFWVKNLGQGVRNRFHFVYADPNENGYLDCSVSAAGNFQLSSWGNYFIDTTAKFRDPSAWYHFVVQFDTTNSTAADRRKLWVNGVSVATNGTAPALNAEYGFNTASVIAIGSDVNSSGTAINFGDFYLAEYHFIDGEALDHTSFGAFDDNGVWQAIEFTGNHNFTPTVTYPAVYVSSPGTYGTVTDVNTVNGNVFTSASSTGAGSIKVEFASAITGVTNVRFKGGGYSVSAGFNIKVNGSTTHTNLSTTSSYAVRTENFTSPIDITSFEIASASDGWALGDLEFSTDSGSTFTAPSGTAAVIPESGVNGFHLDFADGNDIGNDAAGSNNFTANNLSEVGSTINYVDAINGDIAYAYNAFSTSYISNYVNTSTWAITNTAWTGAYGAATNTNVFTPPGGIAVSSSLIVYYGNYNNSSKQTVLTITYTDSTTETATFNSGQNNWMGSFTASNAAGKTVQSFQIVGTTNYNYQSFGGFVVDGQILTSANPDTDVLRDSPTNGNATDDTGAGGELSGNYCTMNPLANYLTLANGNLDASQTSAAHHTSFATIGVSSGKYYWEITKNDGANTSATSVGLGVANVKYTLDSQYFSSSTYDTYIGYMQSGVGLYDGSSGNVRTVTALGSGVEHTTGTWMFAFDFDNGKGWIGKDGTWLSHTAAGNEGNPATGANPCFSAFVSGETYVPMVGMYAATSVTANFGQRAWKYTAPSGFKALCTTNLPTSNVPDGSDYFDVKTYTGSGGLELASTSINTSTAYRHHRILCEGDNNGGTISEIQFFDASGLIDASDTNNAGSSVTSNSNQGLAAWTAFNGTLGGSSYSYGVRKDPSSGFYIAKDWGSGNTKTITAVKIWGVDSYAIAGNSSSTYIKLQGSNDGSTWTDLQEWDDSRTGSWTSSSSTQVAHTSDTTTTISGLEFSPDLVWIKKRSAGVADHALFDIVRGATKRLYPNDTSNEDTLTDTLTAFNSDGFSLGTANDVNANGDTYVGWAWDAGNSTASNTDGSITSSVRANQTAGFSIVSYTSNDGSSATIGHGLNAAPDFVLCKRLNASGDWWAGHVGAGWTKGAYLQVPDAFAANSNWWNNTAPTSSVVTLGSYPLTGSNGSYIAYCFAHVAGYSAFGSYTGNGSNDGAFIYTGFKTKYLLTKPSSAGGDWMIWDAGRQPYNVNANTIQANTSAVEAGTSGYAVDLLSNGFKFRMYGSSSNASGVTFIYAAFAENPFQTNGGLAR